MRAYDLTHVADVVLRRDLPALIAQQRAPNALILAHIAEYDARALFLGDGYPSMFAYCVEELHLSDDEALRRIQVARAARRVPALFQELEAGRVHITAARTLAPYLSPENADGLLAAAANKGRSGIEQLIVERFSMPVVPRKPKITRLMPTPPVRKHVPGHVDDLFSEATPVAPTTSAPEERFEIRFSIGRAAHDRLRRAQSLLGHAVPSGDLEQVYDRAVSCLIAQLERRKFAKTDHPRAQGQISRRRRHIPSAVKRAVWKRDRGQCTFRSESGHRCPASHFLEYDHVVPVARGGKASVDNLRLRCRAHNQYAAERLFGREFMRGKRGPSATTAPGTARRA